jgi:hypothetical protein
MTEWTKEMLNKLTPNAIENVKNTIAKYGNNRWWEFEDKSEMAKWQIFENILMVEWSSFHEGIESLLGHAVFTHEFATMKSQLQNEVKVLCKFDKKIRVHGLDECLNYSYGHATAYVSGSLRDGFYINAATRRTMTKTYPTKYSTENAAIGAAVKFVLKRG